MSEMKQQCGINLKEKVVCAEVVTIARQTPSC